LARILLAEDDSSMREFLVRALARAGHAVTPAEDGKAALAELDGPEADRFDLLIADIVMPGLDGIELARRACATSKRLRVIFITGFAAVTLAGGRLKPPGARMLSKPFHLRELVDQVTRMLAA
jgi:two-component system cell cycle response regulator CpdR